ncbi:unnamed protein product [Protopolystoma xenopodis]|uniref:Uncharacterized protein n=1 Tax=Protopolystoma xenopodis TaxID=117903 RepID=A0A448WZL5_9PLAT|nr:unnamed protein product [Protopolystoma xenopodis]
MQRWHSYKLTVVAAWTSGRVGGCLSVFSSDFVASTRPRPQTHSYPHASDTPTQTQLHTDTWAYVGYFLCASEGVSTWVFPSPLPALRVYLRVRVRVRRHPGPIWGHLGQKRTAERSGSPGLGEPRNPHTNFAPLSCRPPWQHWLYELFHAQPPLTQADVRVEGRGTGPGQ